AARPPELAKAPAAAVRAQHSLAQRSPTQHPSAHPTVCVSIAAASQLRARNAPDHRETLAQTTAAGVINPVYDPQILGHDGMTGVALRQGAEHFDPPRLPQPCLLPGRAVSNDHVRETRRIQEAIFCLQVNAPHLLHHAIEVMDAAKPRALA